MTEIKFKSFSSGSCGNCYFLALVEDGQTQSAIIIDAGVSLRNVKRALASDGFNHEDIDAILITHDHYDHTRSLGSFCKYVKKPIYATAKLHKALSALPYVPEYISSSRRVLSDEGWNEIVPGKVLVKYFVVPHDATQTVGFGILIGGYPFVIMTDLGDMTPEALSFASHAKTVVIESNYDTDMLMGGTYPYELKMRICKGNGHLSNDKCAEAIKQFHHSGLDNIFLCHLSENNNTPQLAYECSKNMLDRIGASEVKLRTLPRRSPSPLFNLRIEE